MTTWKFVMATGTNRHYSVCLSYYVSMVSKVKKFGVTIRSFLWEYSSSRSNYVYRKSDVGYFPKLTSSDWI